MFSRSDRAQPPTLAGSFLYGTGFYFCVAILPDLIFGDKDGWMTEILFGIGLLLAIGPPWIWFWKWRDELLRSLPGNSLLIEPEPGGASDLA
jgi:hypothetical protein